MIGGSRLGRLLKAALFIVPLGAVLAAGSVFWSASSQILHPPGPGDVGDISGCREQSRAVWGDDCGRLTKRFDVDRQEMTFQSQNGYSLAGWKLRRSSSNPSEKVLLYIPGGGSDRREASRYVDLAFSLGYDLVAIDPACQGLSSCSTPGLSYGARESRDILSVVSTLQRDYVHVAVMGSSVGAASILIALPDMPDIAAVIAENPMSSLWQLLRDAPEARDMPDWAITLLVQLTDWRGDFPFQPDALSAILRGKRVPMLLIHSKADRIVPSTHSKNLANAYRGPARVWIAEHGDHGAVWNADPAAYEAKVRDFLSSLDRR
jgi:pimeloyl-ACP methyl ester carboxylesterase